MLLLRVEEGGRVTYPLDLRKEYPYTSFPDKLTKNSLPPNVHFVRLSEKPFLQDRKMNVVESIPIFDGNNWVQQWAIVPLDDEELKLKEVEAREKRNELLRLTDWTQLPDVPNETSNKYKEYRQKLRDFPQQEGFPFNDLPEMTNGSN